MRKALCFNFYLLSIIFRDYFYQFGEIRSINIASAKSCAFVCYTTRMAAEFAADRSFNKAIVNGKRLKVSWGRSQEERSSGGKDDKDKNSKQYAPVPGLPGGKFLKTFKKIFVHFFAFVTCFKQFCLKKLQILYITT